VNFRVRVVHDRLPFEVSVWAAVERKRHMQDSLALAIRHKFLKRFGVSPFPSEADINSASYAPSYLRRTDFRITQLKAQGPSGTCNESKEDAPYETRVRVRVHARLYAGVVHLKEMVQNIHV